MKRIPGVRPAALLFCSVLLAVQVRALNLDLQYVGGDRNMGGGDPNIGGLDAAIMPNRFYRALSP
jgi:hypothetical protein